MRSRRPAQRLGQSAAGQHKDPCQPGIPVAGEEHGLSLPLQGCQGDLRVPHPLCSCKRGVNAPQIHIRRHDEGESLKHGVQGEYAPRRRDEL